MSNSIFARIISLFKNTTGGVPSVEKLALSPDLYSFDFEGVDSLFVQQIDYTKKAKPATNHVITDSVVVERVKAILAALPRNGEEMVSMGPVLVTTVVGRTGEAQKAYVSFFGTRLKTEDTSFYARDGGQAEQQKELFLLVTGRG